MRLTGLGVRLIMAVSESSNDITADIDVADAQGIVNLLKQCDSQIFDGWRSYKSLYSRDVVRVIETVATKVAGVLEDDEGCVVLSGCGTSGRLAYYIAHSFNKIIGKRKVMYTIAGGDKALWVSVEAPEDSCKCGVDDLEAVTKEFKNVVFIGISCGLSAPYIAGQLDHCLQHEDKYTTVLMGFNPLHQARNTPIDNWDKTFSDVATAMSQKGNCYIINPVVGPEAISGSSRMKGGSATKLLCEIIFFTALNTNASTPCPIENLLMCYELTHRVTYNQYIPIADIISSCGQSNYGILSRIDASECVPTFGASDWTMYCAMLYRPFAELDDIQGVMCDGKEDTVATDDNALWCSTVLPDITGQDTVVLLGHGHSEQVISALNDKHCRLKSVSTQPSSEGVSLVFPEAAIMGLLGGCSYASFIYDAVIEMSIKWVLNAISTGAHVLRGKVYHNKMIDVQVSNSKLYNRAIGIIREFSCVTTDVAEEYLLRAIYGPEKRPINATMYSHIELATGQDLVVPRAILMSKLKCSHDKAHSLLCSTPTVRKLLVGII